VRSDGGAVGEHGDTAERDIEPRDAGENADRRIGRRARHLLDAERSRHLVVEHKVRKGPADIDAKPQHQRSPEPLAPAGRGSYRTPLSTSSAHRPRYEDSTSRLLISSF